MAKMKEYFIHHNGAAVFVKTGAFFRSQGGLIQPWGKVWRQVRASSLEQARLKWRPEWDRNEAQR